MENKCSEKQAWAIYHYIYDDKKQNDGLFAPTRSQEVIRGNLYQKNGWDALELKFKLVEAIQERLTGRQASYIILSLIKYDWIKAEEILTK